MKHVLIAYIFLSGIFDSFAQDYSKEQIDSIHLEISAMLRSNNNDSSLLLANKTYKASRSLGYAFGVARSLTLKGFYYLNQANYDSAEVFFNRSNLLYEENIFFEDSILSKYSMVMLGLGILNSRKRSFDVGERYLRQAKKMFVAEKDYERAYSALISIGVNNGIQTKYSEALEDFLAAYNLALESEINPTIAIGNIGLCYYNMGMLDRAITHLKQGLQVDIDSGNRFPQMFKYNNLGKIYTDQNLFDSANYFTLKAYEIAKEYRRYNSAATALINLARLQILTDEHEVASRYMQEALLLADTAGLQGIREKSYGIEASLFYKNGNLDSALYYANKGIKSMLKGSNNRYASYLALLMSEIYEEKNQLDSTLKYFKTHSALEDSVFSRYNRQRFTELFAEMETIEKQREINLLQKQQEIDKAKRWLLVVLIISIILLSLLTFVALILRHKNKRKKLQLMQYELEAKIKWQQTELQQQTLHMININNTISEVEGNLKELRKNKTITYKDIQRTISSISISKSMDKEWVRFEEYFSNIHANFNVNLKEKHKSLTLNERRLASLIKLNLSNREIANIMNIAQRSIIMNRYRLKKKLNLSEEDDLEEYIQTL